MYMYIYYLIALGNLYISYSLREHTTAPQKENTSNIKFKISKQLRTFRFVSNKILEQQTHLMFYFHTTRDVSTQTVQ